MREIRKRDLYLLVFFLNIHRDWGQPRPKAGAKNSVWDSQVSRRDCTAWTLIWGLQAVHSQGVGTRI